MSDSAHVFVSRDAAEKIAAATDTDGRLALTHVPSEAMFVVSMVETAPQVRVAVDIPRQFTALRWGDSSFEGRWVRRPDSGINLAHYELTRRPGAFLPYSEFRDAIGITLDPGAHALLVVTHEPDLPDEWRAAGVAEYAGWHLTREGATPHPVSIEPETFGLTQLEGLWPIDQLSTTRLAVVGCGSIGSAAAEALAAYGVGELRLIDPDRLLWHNLLRHTLGPESVGRHKAVALADTLNARWTTDRVRSFPLDIVRRADEFRQLIRDVDLVLCAADGVAPRRVVSHNARRAAIPSVLASVLDRGAIGEVIRLRPTPRFGCLLCARAAMTDVGALDAEADQELEYGTGTSHLPMTAVPSDLHLVGRVAAKLAVATLLESSFGDGTQQAPGEHALIGLRPGGDLRAPFNLERSGEVRWSTLPPPRKECATCSV